MGTWLRNPKTTQEKKKYDRKYCRGKRSPRRLPDTYDDITRSDLINNKTWKKYRKTQYRIRYL